MTAPVVPEQFQLDLYSCPDPKDLFWIYTIGALNKFAQQTSAYLTQLQNQQQPPPQYKQLKFTTGANVVDSFPINFAWPTAPNDVHVAGVIQGVTDITLPVTVQWQYSSGRGNNTLNISAITGLQASTLYILTLSLV